MKNYNYLISLRNDIGKGLPGSGLSSSTAYIKILDEKNYNLKESLDPQKWAKEILDDSNGGPVIVFVHGYHNDSTKIVGLHKQVKSGLVANLKTDPFTLISFDWPTTTSLIKGYEHDWNNAKISGPRLISDCINFLIKAGVPSNKIHVLTHSMGGRVAEVAFGSTPPSEPIGHVMLTAADVDATSYDPVNNSNILNNFVQYSSSLTCYHSSQDKAMIYSSNNTKYQELPDHGKARLGGITGLNQKTTNQFAKCLDVDCSYYYYENYNDEPDSAQLSHTWYLDTTKGIDFMKDVHNVITDAETFPTRPSNKDRFALDESI